MGSVPKTTHTTPMKAMGARYKLLYAQTCQELLVFAMTISFYSGYHNIIMYFNYSSQRSPLPSLSANLSHIYKTVIMITIIVNQYSNMH